MAPKLYNPFSEVSEDVTGRQLSGLFLHFLCPHMELRMYVKERVVCGCESERESVCVRARERERERESERECE